MANITLSPPGKALITIGGDTSGKNTAQSLSTGITKINVQTQHNIQQSVANISSTTNVKINVKSSSNAVPIDAQSAAYSALIQNTSTGDEEIFNSNQWIYWSQSLLNLLEQGFNPELRLDVQTSISSTPKMIGINIEIPSCLTNIFPDGSYTIQTESGPIFVLAGDAGQNQYQANLVSIPLTNLVM